MHYRPAFVLLPQENSFATKKKKYDFSEKIFILVPHFCSSAVEYFSNNFTG